MNGLQIKYYISQCQWWITLAKPPKHPKAEKGIVKHQNEGFLHWDTVTHKEFMKKQTMDFTLGFKILKWTYWLEEYLVAPLQVFEWWSCQGWTAAVVSGSPSSRGAAVSPALPVHTKEETTCHLEEKAPGIMPWLVFHVCFNFPNWRDLLYLVRIKDPYTPLLRRAKTIGKWLARTFNICQ